MRTQIVREGIQRLVHQAPFRPFLLTLDNRQQVLIEHPENIAFQPDGNSSKGSRDFYVRTGQVRLYSTFGAVSSIAQVDVETNDV